MAWSGKFKNGESFSDLTDDELNRFESEIDPTSIQEITQSQEQKSALANQMREQAKSQFAQDIEEQKRSEYESKFESPLGRIVKNLFPYSTPYDQTSLEKSINVVKDASSLPARVGEELFGAGAEVVGTKLYSNDPSQTEQEIANIGSRFWDNVGNTKSQGIVSDIITDPMLPVMVGVNAIPGAGLLAGLGRFGTGTGSFIASEYAKPGQMSIEENAAPIITASVLNALPALKMLPFKGRTLSNINQTRPVVEGAETVLRDVTNPTLKFVIASEKNVPTKASPRILQDLWKTNTTIDKIAGNVMEAKGTAAGATLGNMAGGPIGGAIGAKYASEQARKLATPENISTLLRGLGTLQNTLGSDKIRYFAPVVDNTRQNLLRRD